MEFQNLELCSTKTPEVFIAAHASGMDTDLILLYEMYLMFYA